MKILITGGAGFIGCNLADHFAAKGHQIVVYDNLSRPGSMHNLQWLRQKHASRLIFKQDDLLDYTSLKEAVANCDVIYHCAGQTAVTTSVKNPRMDFEQNALGTLNVLEAMRKSGQKQSLIFASTNKVYGSLEHLEVIEEETRYTYKARPNGISEAEPLDFHSPYGCSKGAADQYVRDYARIYGLRTVVFRQSCIYGPRQMGVEDQGWVAWFVIAVLTGQPFTIYGNGKQVRDLLYISDLARAFELATQNIDRIAGQVYNIGGGMCNTLSVWHEFGPLLSELCGRTVRPSQFSDWRPGDQWVFFCDISKAKQDFGWMPQVSVYEGVSRLWAWAKDHINLFQHST